jgi:ribosome-binding protein aMBF1 (putative translation factor)
MHQDWDPIAWSKPSDLEKSQGKSLKRKRLAPHDSDDPPPPVPITRNLRILIQAARTARGLTQKQLATKANLPANVVNSYESGTAVPDKAVIQRLSQVLGCNLTKMV